MVPIVSREGSSSACALPQRLNPVPKPNYRHAKRQKEQQKKDKKAEKAARKASAAATEPAPDEPVEPQDD